MPSPTGPEDARWPIRKFMPFACMIYACIARSNGRDQIWVETFEKDMGWAGAGVGISEGDSKMYP